MNKHYAQFFDSWYAFQHNEDDDMQWDLWDALEACRTARNNPTKEWVIHIAFELYERPFTAEDGNLYTIRYNRKKRIPELLKGNALYEDLLGSLDEIDTYKDLSARMKNITLSIPLDADSWLLYEEKISQQSSLADFVEKELLRKHPGGIRTVKGSVYLRTAKKIIHTLGTKWLC